MFSQVTENLESKRGAEIKKKERTAETGRDFLIHVITMQLLSRTDPTVQPTEKPKKSALSWQEQGQYQLSCLLTPFCLLFGLKSQVPSVNKSPLICTQQIQKGAYFRSKHIFQSHKIKWGLISNSMPLSWECQMDCVLLFSSTSSFVYNVRIPLKGIAC